MEVVDIRFEDIQGVQTLVYELEIEGEFTSETVVQLQGQTGRLDIDMMELHPRANDLSMWDSELHWMLLLHFST